MATAIYARAERPTERLVHQRSTYSRDDHQLLMSQHTVYEFCLSKAYEETADIHNEEERIHAALTLLAKYCQQSDIPMAIAQHQAMFSIALGADKLLVKKVFENAYQQSQLKKYQQQRGLNPYRHVPAETLLTLKINNFLNENYELRKNVMRGVAEYRHRTGIGFAYQDLTEEALMHHNLQYQRLNGLDEMLMAVIQKPQKDDEARWITLPELSELLRKTFGGFKQDVTTLQKIGLFLKRPEHQFENKRTNQGMIYKIKLR